MLRETIDLDGLRLGLVDTAGIRVSEDEVEQEGVVRARKAAEAADLVILVLDRSRALEDIDVALLQETASAARVVVINKTDLPAALTLGGEAAGIRDWGLGVGGAGIEVSAGGVGDVEAGSLDPAGGGGARTNPQSRIPNPRSGVVLLSLKTGEGVNEVRAAMRAALEVAEPLRDTVMVTNVRHETLLREARESLARAIANIEQASPSTALGANEMASEELVLADIADARHALEEVTGKRTSEDLLRRIFERFCIGK
jgi:tRNA modification GTPase